MIPKPALAALAILAGCATPGTDRVAQRDPWHGYNRFMYGVNRGIDKAVLRPSANVYRKLTPVAARRGLTNAFNNVDEPLTFVNAVLQAKPKVALRALTRFVINSTVGVLGLGDPATKWGIAAQEEDFGQTFAVWGIPSGPYFVLPLLGPSTLRDTAGLGAAFAGGDPYVYGIREAHLATVPGLALTGASLLDTRSKLIDSGVDQVIATSADEYTTVRSAYLQSRQNEIYDGTPPIEDDEEEDAPAAAITGGAPATTPAAEGIADQPPVPETSTAPPIDPLPPTPQ